MIRDIHVGGMLRSYSRSRRVAQHAAGPYRFRATGVSSMRWPVETAGRCNHAGLPDM
jgi:hypothetical protein